VVANRCEHLHELDLKETKMTDVGLQHLARAACVRRLRRLRLVRERAPLLVVGLMRHGRWWRLSMQHSSPIRRNDLPQPDRWWPHSMR
jgi:hypothetical protein